MPTGIASQNSRPRSVIRIYERSKRHGNSQSVCFNPGLTTLDDSSVSETLGTTIAVTQLLLTARHRMDIPKVTAITRLISQGLRSDMDDETGNRT